MNPLRLVVAGVSIPDPYNMTRREFLNPKSPRPKSGYRLLYHATANKNLKRIAREGLLTKYSKSPPMGSIWATTDPDEYSRNMSLVVFQVPKDDPMIEYTTYGKKQAIIHRDILLKDIVTFDPAIDTPLGLMRLSEYRESDYAETYYDEVFGK